MIRPDHHGERGAASLRGSAQAHAPAAIGRPPDAGPWASRTACACPRRPRARWSGWSCRSSYSLASCGRRCAAAVIKRFRPAWKPGFVPGERRDSKMKAHFLLMFARDSVGALGGPKTSHGKGFRATWQAASRPRIPAACSPGFWPRRTNSTGARYGGSDRGRLRRSARSSLPLLANQSSIGSRREQIASADLARQSQQIQSVAKESQSEARRLASAIETLNSDRDRLYSRVAVLEQGLDSVTGAIARQNSLRRRHKPRRPRPRQPRSGRSASAAAPTAAAPIGAAPASAETPATAQKPSPAPGRVTGGGDGRRDNRKAGGG